MSDQLITLRESHWTELRDERGKLCARLEPSLLILEIRRSDRDLVAHFDLRDYLEVFRGLDNDVPLRDD